MSTITARDAGKPAAVTADAVPPLSTTPGNNGRGSETGSEVIAALLCNVKRFLDVRQRFMQASGQLDNPKDGWGEAEIDACGPLEDYSTAIGGSRHESRDYSFHLSDRGVYEVTGPSIGPIDVPSISEYYQELELLSILAADGPTKTLCFRRLRLLQSRFAMHLLQHEQDERAEQKRVPHRDFYNVRKVDTHVHHSSSMNCKHLLRFIKTKLKDPGADKEAVIYRDGRHLTLAQVFESLRLTAYDLSIDALDMHAHQDSFHRFDRFNLKYNPLGEARLREIFLKTDNLVKGRYLAELTRELILDLEASKYQMAEYRLSVYGRDPGEWSTLAAWICDNRLFSPNVRWMVQLPRLYHTYHAAGLVSTFQHFLLSTCPSYLP